MSFLRVGAIAKYGFAIAVFIFLCYRGLLGWFLGSKGDEWFPGRKRVFLGGGSGEGDDEVYGALGVAGIPWEGYVVALVG